MTGDTAFRNASLVQNLKSALGLATLDRDDVKSLGRKAHSDRREADYGLAHLLAGHAVDAETGTRCKAIHIQLAVNHTDSSLRSGDTVDAIKYAI